MRFGHVLVVGAGQMGGGIAQVCASHGYDVTLLEADEAHLTTSIQRISKALERDVERGRLTAERYGRAIERLHRTTQALMEEFLRNRDRLDRREPRKKPRA